MNTRVKLLRELVADGLYVVDEVAVADAVVLRATVRWAVPDGRFGGLSASDESHVRSFRPHRGARSFRLARAERRSLGERGDGLLQPGELRE